MELVGIKFRIEEDKYKLSRLRACDGSGIFNGLGGLIDSFNGDPYAFVLSANLHRRHLTPEQKRELIVKVLKAKPEQSNRQTAKQVKADDKTVAKVRSELEATAEIPQLNKTTGRDGKARPARRHTAEPVPPTPDNIVASTPVDALCATLAAMKERDPALAQACFRGIVARLRDAMDYCPRRKKATGK